MNHYDLLGVPITATSKQIKTAYKRLAITNHPDKVPKEKQNEAVTKFKKLNKAYQTLTNPNSRYEYDEKLGKKNLLQRCQSYKYPKQQYPSTTKIFRSKSKESDLSNSQPSFSFNQRETTDLLNEVILTNKYAFFSSHNHNNSKANQKQKKQQKNVKKYKSNNKHNHKKNETNNHINSKNQNKKERKNQNKERERERERGMERGMEREREKDFEPKRNHKPKNNSKAATNQKNKNKPKNYSKTTNNHKKVQNNKNERPSNFSEFKTSNKRTPFKNQNHFSNNYPNSNSNSNSKSKTKPKSRKYRKKIKKINKNSHQQSKYVY